MKRAIVCSICSAGLALGVMSQDSTQRTVSGPDQINPKAKTGKSYKKGSKGHSEKVDSSKTGQDHRLANTGRLTKDQEASGAANKPADNSSKKQ